MSTGSSVTARSTSCSRSMISRLARPAMHAPGCPAYVLPWRKGRGVQVPERRAHSGGDDDGTERNVARADSLRTRDQVGREAVALAAEPAAETPESRDHLVRDQEDAALAADRLDRGPVPVWRGDGAAGADQRLTDERRRGSAEGIERPSEIVGIVVRDLGDASDERAEAVPDGGDPRQRRAVRIRAVVRVAPRHDHRSLGLTRERPVAAHDLGGRVDRLTAPRAEEDAGSAIGASPATRPASSSAGTFAMSPKMWWAASVLSCVATASAISARPCPTFANQSPAVASMYSVPPVSQTVEPSPRARTSSCPSTFPIAANGCQRCAVGLECAHPSRLNDGRVTLRVQQPACDDSAG